MHFTITINQPAALELDLSLQESVFVSFLLTGCHWMQRLRENPDFLWVSNTKLVEELPMICSHPGSARRHMAKLEEKGVITRITVRNKSYFRLEQMYLSLLSNTLSGANTSVHPEPEANTSVGLGQTDLCGQGKQNCAPKANRSVHRSIIPTSIIPTIKKEKPPAFIPPSEIPNELWAAYLVTRKERKRPMNSGSLSLAARSIMKSVDETGHAMSDVMELLIASGWQTCKPEYVTNALGLKIAGQNLASQDDDAEVERLFRAKYGDSEDQEALPGFDLPLNIHDLSVVAES